MQPTQTSTQQQQAKPIKKGFFSKNKSNTNPNSTQNILQIAEVRDGLVIMNDGTYRAVVFAKSINFDLMSNQEREAIELNYQGFVNNLYFPVQIFIRSQKVDISKYLNSLVNQKNTLDNILLSMMMDDYIQFIADITENSNIMDKKFYITIPFHGAASLQDAKKKSRGLLSSALSIFSGNKSGVKVQINEAELNKAKIELKNRVQSVLGGLSNMGVQGVALNTQELIELYYDFYNPDTATNQSLSTKTGINAPVIRKGQN